MILFSFQRIMSSSFRNKFLSSKPKLFSLITSMTTTTTTRSSSYPFVNSSGRPPLMVSSILDETERDCPSGHEYDCDCGDDHHHLVAMMTNGLQYENEDQIYDDYVKALAPIVGSEEEAKKKIYLVSCGDTYGFGVELESRYVDSLSRYGAIMVIRDVNYTQRKQDPYVQLPAQFTPMNRDQRLENIFSYHYLSKEQKNKRWKDDHWLIAIKQPAIGFGNYDEITDYIVQLLTKILGSKEEARKRIYVIWYKLPFGFGAEIDKEASEKLREMKDDVLAVLPDYAFDVKDESCFQVRQIYPYVYKSSQIHPWIHGSRYRICRQHTGVEEESHDHPIELSAKSDLATTSDYKHRFISMKKPVGDASTR